MADNDIAALLAGAAKTNANFDFGSLNKSYWQGLEEQYKQKERELFKDGVPMKGDAVDWDAVSSRALQAGGVGALGNVTALQKVMADLGIRENLARIGNETFPAPGQPAQRSIPPSISGNPATQTEPKPVAADDPTMTFSPRQVSAVNAPQPQSAPIVPRPVSTTAVPPQPPPQQAASPFPPPSPAPQVAQAPAPLSQASPNQVVNDRFGGTPAATAGMVTDPTLGGLIPPGRTIEQQLGMLRQRAAVAASTGVRDASKPYIDAIDAIQKAVGQYRESGLKERQSIVEPAVKLAIEGLGEGKKKTEAIADGIDVARELTAQLNGKAGIFSGQFANAKLTAAKIGAAVSDALGFKTDRSAITDTESFRSLVGKKVAQTVKAFGSGTSITNQDREYAEKMEAGSITLDETSIRRILGITDRINRSLIDKHNEGVDKLIAARPELATLASTMKVEQPPGGLPRFNSKQELQTAIRAGRVRQGQTFVNGNGDEQVLQVMTSPQRRL